MPFSLVSLLLPTYFNVHDRINAGTEIYGDSRVSLKKLSSVECITVCNNSQMILISVHEMIQIFFIFISYRFLAEVGGWGTLEVSPKSFPVLSLAKAACYWNTVVL